MLSPALPARCYTDPAWYQAEKKAVFGRLWMLGAMRQQLAEENSFVTRDFCGTPVFLQNVGGRIRAFRNTCAHRGMPIHVEPSGVRKMICPYHGWSYGDDGRVKGIPTAQVYNICEAEKKGLALQSFATHEVGAFVFVNLDAQPLDIHAQFNADTLRLLAHASQYFSHEISYSSFEANYNWKLNFENVLDWNHVPHVHRSTFAPLLSVEQAGNYQAARTAGSRLIYPGSPLENIQFSADPDLSRDIALPQISRMGRVAMPYQPHWYSELYEGACDIGAFLACNLFPNLNFGSVHGENFYVQQYMPLDAGRIEYHSWVFTARLKPGLKPQPHLLWGIHHAEKKVIDEDVVLLEALQRALGDVTGTGVMGDHETCLVAMGRWLRQQVEAPA